MLVVDQNSQLVGALVDAYSAVVLRKVGLDWLALLLGPGGFAEGDIFFYHDKADCSDPRMVLTQFTYGFVYPAQFHNGTFFYTKVLDPMMTGPRQSVRYRERFAAGVDASVVDPSRCEASEFGTDPQSVGSVVTASDSAVTALVTPFKIK